MDYVTSCEVGNIRNKAIHTIKQYYKEVHTIVSMFCNVATLEIQPSSVLSNLLALYVAKMI